MSSYEAIAEQEALLVANITQRLVDIDACLERINNEWVAEDLVYRFWHQSFKVYLLQPTTEAIVTLLRELAPGERGLNPWFEEIVKEGTGRKFDMSDNDDWVRATRPVIDAFFHARYMLEMVAKYGKIRNQEEQFIASGWAAVLCLYNLR